MLTVIDCTPCPLLRALLDECKAMRADESTRRRRLAARRRRAV